MENARQTLAGRYRERARRVVKAFRGAKSVDIPVATDQVRTCHQPAGRQGMVMKYQPAWSRADKVIE
jgi:hypothetical protein